MKKLIVLLSTILIFMTGCSVTPLDKNDYAKNIKTLLSEKNKFYNVNFEGYKYYIPEGLKFLNKQEYNAVLRDKYNNKYYLYVDAISRYHKIPSTYEVNDSAYYSSKLSYNKSEGYIEINESKGKYYVEMVFNYAKIETIADKKSLSYVIDNMCYILRSIKFNDKILESLIGDNVLSYAEEIFTLFDTETSQEDFLEVVSRYDKEYSKAKDQEELELDDE